MLTEEDLAAAFATARAHLRTGGVFLLVPDFVAETFEPGCEADGSDGDGRAWTTYQDPARRSILLDTGPNCLS